MLNVAVGVWGVRLASYLFARIIKTGEMDILPIGRGKDKKRDIQNTTNRTAEQGTVLVRRVGCVMANAQIKTDTKYWMTLYLHVPFLCLMMQASWCGIVRGGASSARACRTLFFPVVAKKTVRNGGWIPWPVNCHYQNGTRVYMHVPCTPVRWCISSSHLRQRTLLFYCASALGLCACFGQARTSGWLGFSLARMKGGWTALDRFSR